MIYLNGCSFTYGDELDGSRHPDGHRFDTHHHLTYAAKLSKHLNLRYLNQAQNGSSNEKIFRRTLRDLKCFPLREEPEKIDLVVIQWSSPGRFELVEEGVWESDLFIKKESDANQVHPSIKFNDKNCRPSFLWEVGQKSERNEILKTYVENVYTVETSILHLLSYMNTVHLVCELMKIPLIQTFHHYGTYHLIMKTLKTQSLPEYKREVANYLKILPPTSRVGAGFYEDIYSISIDKYGIHECGHPKEEAHTDFADMLYNEVICEYYPQLLRK